MALVIFATVVSAWGNWEADSFPAGDPANYLLFGEYVLREHAWVYHGYFSIFPSGHPGPVMFVLSAVGLSVGRTVPGLSADVGVLVVFNLVYWSLVAYSAAVMAKLTNRTATALVMVALYCWMIGTPSSVFAKGPTFMYGPSLAAPLILAAGCSLFALVRRYPWAPATCVLFGGLSVQIALETAPLGGLVACCGLFTALRVLRTDEAGRQSRPRRVAGYLASFAVGLGPLLVRWRHDGLDLPVRYLREARTLMVRQTHTTDLFVRFTQHWGTSRLLGAALMIVVVVTLIAGVCLKSVRTMALVAFLLIAIVVLVTVFLTKDHYGQTVQVMLIPLLTVVPAVGLLAPRIKAVPVALAVAAVLLLWAANVSFRVDKPSRFVWSAAESTVLAGQVGNRFHDASTVGVLVDRSDGGGHSTAVMDTIRVMMLALYRGGVTPCAPQLPPTDAPDGLRSCPFSKPKHWLLVLPESRPPADDRWQLAGTLGEVRVYEVPAEAAALVYCPAGGGLGGPGRTWVYPSVGGPVGQSPTVDPTMC